MLTRRRLLKGLASACAVASMAWSPIATVALRPQRDDASEALDREMMAYVQEAFRHINQMPTFPRTILMARSVADEFGIDYDVVDEDHDDGGPPGPSDGLRPDA